LGGFCALLLGGGDGDVASDPINLIDPPGLAWYDHFDWLEPVNAVVCVHDKDMKEPWCLATSRNEPANDTVGFYGKRFTIEETFRDEKDPNFGMGVLDTHIADPARRDRLLLVFAVTFVLLTMLGRAGEEVHADRLITSTSP
jgi:hypothetical protein